MRVGTRCTTCSGGRRKRLPRRTRARSVTSLLSLCLWSRPRRSRQTRRRKSRLARLASRALRVRPPLATSRLWRDRHSPVSACERICHTPRFRAALSVSGCSQTETRDRASRLAVSAHSSFRTAHPIPTSRFKGIQPGMIITRLGALKAIKKKRVHWYYYCEKQLYTLYLA